MRPVCYDVCIALILIAEPPKQVINLVIHLGNPGLGEEMTYQARRRYNREQNPTVQGDPNYVLSVF